MAIVLLLALASGAFADSDYIPVDWITVTEDGSVKATIGILSLNAGSGGGCINVDTTINGVSYSIILSRWQVLIGSEWVDVPDTEAGGVCGIDVSALPSGENRIVVEISVDGEVGKYASANAVLGTGDPLTIAEPVTAVRSVTWGSLKSKDLVK